MTDAQIRLYAALRVSVPPSWQISGTSSRWSTMQQIRFTRVNQAAKRIERFSMIVDRPLLEEVDTEAAIRGAVLEAQKNVGNLEGVSHPDGWIAYGPLAR